MNRGLKPYPSAQDHGFILRRVYGSIQPYQFEPYLSDASDIEENWGNESSDDERRLQSKEWYDIDTRCDS